MEAQLVSWIDGTSLHDWSSHTSWVFVTAQTAHFMGLSLLLGSLAVLDLRIVNVLRRFPLQPLLCLIPLAIGGFAIQVASGTVMVFADPAKYFDNPGFQLKMVLLLVAGANALWFSLAEHSRLRALPASAPVPVGAKIVAMLSFVTWLAVLGLGRFMTYLEGLTWGTLFQS